MARKRADGDGSVYFDRGRKRWIGELVVNGKRVRVTGRDKTGTAAKLRRLITSVADGTLSTNRATTVADAIDRFVERSMPNRRGGRIAPSTRENHQWAARIIVEHLGATRVSVLSVGQVEAMLDKLVQREDPLSKASLVKVRSTLRLALDECVKRGEAVRNVARVADIHPSAQGTKRRTSLEPDDAVRFLEAVGGERNGAMWALMLRLGLRWEEVAAIYWSELHGDVLNITRTARRDRGRIEVVGDMKNESSRRSLKLPADLMNLVATHRTLQLAERLAAPAWHDEQLMFTSPTGHVLDPTNCRKHLKAICERNGITVPAPTGPRPPTPHELRHSTAALLVYSNVPLDQIADLLGHSTTRMLESNYRHRLRTVTDTAVKHDWLTKLAAPS